MSGKPINLKPSEITLHPRHPAHNLPLPLQESLLNLRIESQTLQRLAKTGEFHVIRNRSRYRLISGWHLWAQLRLRGLDPKVPSRIVTAPAPDEIAAIGIDDLLRPLLLPARDEVALRVVAGLLLEHLGEEHRSRRKLNRIKRMLGLPTRRRDSLRGLLADQDPIVAERILAWPKPIGGRPIGQPVTPPEPTPEPPTPTEETTPTDHPPAQSPRASTRQPSLFADQEDGHVDH